MPPEVVSPALPDPDVIAAGAVVLRKGRVLLIHRPKYDDWSFPKGKRDPGEHELTTAVREVQEETGLEVRLGVPLAPTAYQLSGGGVKLVYYWLGRVYGDPDVSGWVPNNEVDRVEWVPVDKAVDRLSFDRDRDVLVEAAADPKRTSPLIILRHGKARARRQWKGDDRSRPLTPTGERQAQALVPLLASYAVRKVYTSSSTRCSQTVWPYGLEANHKIHATPALSEERSTPERIGRLLRDLIAADQATVVCTHRPVLPIVLDQLGIEVDPLRPAEMVVMHHRKGQLKAIERQYPGS